MPISNLTTEKGRTDNEGNVDLNSFIVDFESEDRNGEMEQINWMHGRIICISH